MGKDGYIREVVRGCEQHICFLLHYMSVISVLNTISHLQKYQPLSISHEKGLSHVHLRRYLVLVYVPFVCYIFNKMLFASSPLGGSFFNVC